MDRTQYLNPLSVRWPIYIINSVDQTKFLYTKKEGFQQF